MADTPFAVVIPTFQRQATILRAVRSVLDQRYEPFSLVVVDDGSTDGTGELVASVNDDRLRVISQANQGRCAARNAGAAATTEPWLVFLDSDDELLCDALASFDEVCRRDESDLVVGSVIRTSDGQDVLGSPKWDDARQLPWALAAGSFAIRRSLFERVGRYCTELSFSEHTEMVFRMRSLSPRPSVAMTPAATARIEVRPGRYDPGVQYRTALHLLGHIRVELADDRSARSRFHGIAGVAAARLGRRSEARRHLLQAFRDRPCTETAARLGYSLLPSAVDRWTGRWRSGDRAAEVMAA